MCARAMGANWAGMAEAAAVCRAWWAAVRERALAACDIDAFGLMFRAQWCVVGQQARHSWQCLHSAACDGHCRMRVLKLQ